MAFVVSATGTVAVNRNTANPTIALTTGASDELLILTVYIDDITESDLNGVPTDGDGDTYVQAHVATNGNQKQYVFYVDAPTQSSSKTITVNTNGTTDTIVNVQSYTGTFDVVGVTASATGSGTVATVTFTPNNADSLIINAGGTANNSTATYGTNQTEIDQGLNGGAEKFAGAASQEIITAGGSNDQVITWSKSGAFVSVAVEFELLVPLGPISGTSAGVATTLATLRNAISGTSAGVATTLATLRSVIIGTAAGIATQLGTITDASVAWAGPVIESFSTSTLDTTQQADTIFASAPSGLVAGDLIVILALSENLDTNDWPTTLTGYNVISGADNVDDVQMSIYWRIATGDSNDGFPNLTLTRGGGDYAVGWALRISGAHSANPFDITPNIVIGVSDGFTLAAETSVRDNVLAIYAFGADGSDLTPFSTSGTGWTIATAAEEEPDNDSNDPSGIGCEWGQKNIPTAGTTNDVVVSYAISESEGYVGIILLITPERTEGTSAGVATTDATLSATIPIDGQSRKAWQTVFNSRGNSFNMVASDYEVGFSLDRAGGFSGAVDKAHFQFNSKFGSPIADLGCRLYELAGNREPSVLVKTSPTTFDVSTFTPTENDLAFDFEGVEVDPAKKYGFFLYYLNVTTIDGSNYARIWTTHLNDTQPIDSLYRLTFNGSSWSEVQNQQVYIRVDWGVGGTLTDAGGGAIDGTSSGVATTLATLRSTLSGTSVGIATTLATLRTPLIGTSAGVGSQSGTLSAIGNLSGTASGVATTLATLRSTLSGTSAGAATVSGTLVPLGIAGTSDGVATVSGTLRSTLSGSADGVATQSGTITGIGTLSGTSAGTSNLLGTLRTPLIGTAAGSSSQSGTLQALGDLAGTAAGVATQLGTLSAIGTLAGTSDGAATGTGTLRSILEGTSAGIATTEGHVTNAAAGPGPISGTSSGVATLLGTLRSTLSGTANGVATTSATLIGRINIDGTANGVATVTGTLRGIDLIDGTANGSSTVSGTITGIGTLAGTSSGVSTQSGTITGIGTLVGTAIGSSSTLGTLIGIDLIDGTANGSSTVSGTLQSTLPVEKDYDTSLTVTVGGIDVEKDYDVLLVVAIITGNDPDIIEICIDMTDDTIEVDMTDDTIPIDIDLKNIDCD